MKAVVMFVMAVAAFGQAAGDIQGCRSPERLRLVAEESWICSVRVTGTTRGGKAINQCFLEDGIDPSKKPKLRDRDTLHVAELYLQDLAIEPLTERWAGVALAESRKNHPSSCGWLNAYRTIKAGKKA